MKQVKHDLLTENYTRVYHEDEKDMKNGAPHNFVVTKKLTAEEEEFLGVREQALTEVNFQNGPIKVAGVNGVNNEDLIIMVISRLEHFQKGEYACRENAVAITKLEEALMWLRKRTINRERRNVKGTHEK